MPAIELSLRYADMAFTVDVANVSAEPVRLWSDRYSYGYSAISFRVLPAGGTPCVVRRRAVRWTVNAPEVIVIEPGGAHSETFEWQDGTWDLKDCAAGPKVAGAVSAVWEVRPDENTAKHGAVTGRYESNPVRFAALAEVLTGE